MEFINLFYTMIRDEKRPIHPPAWYRLTVRGFVLVQVFFMFQTLLFVLLVYSFFENFCNVFSYSKQNNGEKILQNSESRSDDTRCNCCEDFLQFGHSQVVSSSKTFKFCLRFSIFFLCKQLLLSFFFKAFTSLNPK